MSLFYMNLLLGFFCGLNGGVATFYTVEHIHPWNAALAAAACIWSGLICIRTEIVARNRS